MYRKELALWLSHQMRSYGSSAALAELIDVRPSPRDHGLPPEQASIVEADLAEGLRRRSFNDGWIR